MIIVFIFYICVCLDESEFRILQGCLSLGDGSKYDGMWRYGKKSGLGTFYFNNGDIYRGSWRDDLMHGKVPIFLHWVLMVVYKFIIQILVRGALLPHAINFLFFVSLSFWKLWHFNTHHGCKFGTFSKYTDEHAKWLPWHSRGLFEKKGTWELLSSLKTHL